MALRPPPVVVGRYEPARDYGQRDLRATDTLEGLGVSPGAMTGRARVIMRHDDDQRVQEGEILVAPFTDPGWVPQLLPAAGIVMDLGGMLSHGSIIAREYGIPAVVNVGTGTSAITTGMLIRVDGDRGVVNILE
jgi:pyruvate,water dikinase